MGLCYQQETILPFIPMCDINVGKRDVCPGLSMLWERLAVWPACALAQPWGVIPHFLGFQPAVRMVP